MKAPWGATYYPGAWSLNATTRTITNIQGNAGDIELVFVSGPYTSNIQVTASGAGGSFGTTSLSMPGSSGYPGPVGSIFISWRARILTSSDVHSVTADGSIGGGSGYWSTSNQLSFSGRRTDVFIIANPMDVAASDLLTMCRSRHYTDATQAGFYQGGGYGATVSFPHTTLPFGTFSTPLKNFGATRLDYGIITKEFNNSSSQYDLGSRPEQSFSTSDRNGFTNSPYYGTAQDGSNSPNDTLTDASWNTAQARTAEVVVRYTRNALSNNFWAESNWGEVQYTNKHFNWSTLSYVSLPSFLGAFSFVFPNYEGPKVLI